jgi:hypothetical protein
VCKSFSHIPCSSSSYMSSFCLTFRGSTFTTFCLENWHSYNVQPLLLLLQNFCIYNLLYNTRWTTFFHIYLSLTVSLLTKMHFIICNWKCNQVYQTSMDHKLLIAIITLESIQYMYIYIFIYNYIILW